MRYKFSASSFDKRRVKELTCIYYLGQEAWNTRKASVMLPNGKADPKKWDQFLDNEFKQIFPLVDMVEKPVKNTEDADNIIIYTLTKRGEEEPKDNRPDFIYWHPKDVNKVCQNILECASKEGRRYTFKDLIHEIELNKMDSYIGFTSMDEEDDSYVYIYNKEYEDVNMRMKVSELTVNNFVNGMSLVLTGDYYINENCNDIEEDNI